MAPSLAHQLESQRALNEQLEQMLLHLHRCSSSSEIVDKTLSRQISTSYSRDCNTLRESLAGPLHMCECGKTAMGVS